MCHQRGGRGTSTFIHPSAFTHIPDQIHAVGLKISLSGGSFTSSEVEEPDVCFFSHTQTRVPQQDHCLTLVLRAQYSDYELQTNNSLLTTSLNNISVLFPFSTWLIQFCQSNHLNQESSPCCYKIHTSHTWIWTEKRKTNWKLLICVMPLSAHNSFENSHGNFSMGILENF